MQGCGIIHIELDGGKDEIFGEVLHGELAEFFLEGCELIRGLAVCGVWSVPAPVHQPKANAMLDRPGTPIVNDMGVNFDYSGFETCFAPSAFGLAENTSQITILGAILIKAGGVIYTLYKGGRCYTVMY